MAANARAVAWICRTFLSWCWTVHQSPPSLGFPQQTTDPSAKMAANALPVASICWTCLSWSWTAEQSPKRPQATTDPSAKIAANAPIAVDLYDFLYTRELILNSGLVFAIVWIAPRNDRSVGQDRQQGTTSTHGLNLARILELILKCGPVTTNEWMACIAPGNQWSICQNCGKCTVCGLNFLDIPGPIWNFWAVTNTTWMAPGHHGSISQDGSECATCGFNLLHILELVLNCGAVTAIVQITPGNDWSIRQQRGKCASCGLNFLHTAEPILNCGAVTTEVWIAPGNDGSISQDGSKCTLTCGLNLLHITELIFNWQAATASGLPHVMTWLPPEHQQMLWEIQLL